MLDVIDGRRCPSMLALQVDVFTDVFEGCNVLKSLKHRPIRGRRMLSLLPEHAFQVYMNGELVIGRRS